MLEVRSGFPTVPLDEARSAQKTWAARTLRGRLEVLRTWRQEVTAGLEPLMEALASVRVGSGRAELLSSEIIPTLDACRFLEDQAENILRPRRVPNRGRPAWLAGVSLEVHRDPVGIVLVVAPSNYPLYLAAVQSLQALAAGNAVLVKPAPGCSRPLLQAFAGRFPAGLVTVLPEDVSSVHQALEAGVDKVVVTGSRSTGTAILNAAAASVTPVIAELSGCDAMFVCPGADLDLVARALQFSLRLNRGCTCMAPRRVFVPRERLSDLESRLEFETTWSLPSDAASHVNQALKAGARLVAGAPDRAPVVLSEVPPACSLLREAVMAAVVSLQPVDSMEAALAQDEACPYGLTASVFGPEAAARRVAARVRAGVVTVNDVLAPTADPRLAFGGRGASGFGLTRGPEGLLEMTVPRSVLNRERGPLYHLDPPSAADEAVLTGYLRMFHHRSWFGRLRGMVKMVMAVGRERARKARERRRKL